MAGMGETLRGAREEKGLSLKQVEEATKIRTKYLDALEREDFGALPGKVYAIGFARTYAKFLGLDSEELALQCRSLLSDIERDPDGGDDLSPAIYMVPKDHSWRKRARSIAALLVVLGLFIVAYWVVAHTWAPSSTVNPNGQPAEGTQPPPPGPSQPSPTQPEVPVAHQGLELGIRVTQDQCWARVVADGVKVYEGFLRAGDQKNITAQKEIVARLGNPGVVSLNLNGKDLGLAGKAGQPVTKRFTTP